ncbi:Bug family tripartite tricarboxylate transporter substrate binding protein [Azohydromonas australica]|uniref:Bug family tripartite tricarboxylate transporter substrate binding protein n=1 Tax=Azohydromonas australica TaxID=364039 RepID=UPI0004288CFA|nr:tripartite tricarboxylate transporter substrate-binding protein [Azohydromonas australica]
MHRRDFLRTVGLGLGSLSTAAAAWSQPGKLLTVYVGYPAGGSPDLVARTVAPRLSQALQQKVIIDNRAGAGGGIAMDVLRKAPADGSALVLTPSPPLTINPFVYPRLAYNAFSDFTPVCRVVTFDLALAVPATHPAKTMREFVEWAKKNPNLASYGVPGLGSTPHFLGYLIAQASGIDYRVIGYRGGPQMSGDLIGGQLPSAIGVLSTFLQDHRTGKVRVLATAGASRSSLLPDVPTLAEALGTSAIRDVMTATEWYGLMAPAGTAPSVIASLNAAVEDVLREPKLVQQLTSQGHDPALLRGAAFGDLIRKDQDRWRAVVKESGFKLET